MITTVIFDLDGTLTNTLNDIASSMNRALALHGLPQHPLDAYRQFVGNGAKKLAERAVGAHQELAADVLADYQAWYEKHAMDTTRPYPGVEHMLKELVRDGLTLCVLSNKPNLDTIHVVNGFFPDTSWAIVRGQMPGVPVKPHPAAPEAMMDALCISADGCLYVGDSCVDVETAHNANMACAGACWGFRGRQELQESGADYLLDNPGDLPALIRDLNRGVIRN